MLTQVRQENGRIRNERKPLQIKILIGAPDSHALPSQILVSPLVCGPTSYSNGLLGRNEEHVEEVQCGVRNFHHCAFCVVHGLQEILDSIIATIQDEEAYCNSSCCKKYGPNGYE